MSTIGWYAEEPLDENARPTPTHSGRLDPDARKVRRAKNARTASRAGQKARLSCFELARQRQIDSGVPKTKATGCPHPKHHVPAGTGKRG